MHSLQFRLELVAQVRGNPSRRPFEEASRDQLNDLGVRHETERPRGSDVGVDRAFRDAIRISPALGEFELGACSERPNLFEQPGPLLGGVLLPRLLPAAEVVALMMQGCG
jgi:hypothetical protein